MKILFFANRIPYPPYRGDKLKIFNLAKRLQKGNELYLLTFAQTKEEYKYKLELEKIFKEVHLVYLPKWKSAMNCIAAAWDSTPMQVLYFRSAEMRKELDVLLDKHSFDVVHVQHLRMSPYLSEKKAIPRVLDLPDAFSMYWQRRSDAQKNSLKKVFEDIEQKRVMFYEHDMLPRYDMSLVCSSEDRRYLQQMHNVKNINLLPNGVDLDIFSPKQHDYSHNHTLLFTGNMDYSPNVDAVVYFANDILPQIRHKYPNTKLIIAGQRPVKKVKELACDYIKVTGFIQDLATVYNEASIVVAPLRFGAGTQNKVLEAMAMGIPVVCSNIGFMGLDIESGEGAYMETDPTAFAERVMKLLSSEKLRKEVGQKGTSVISSKFGWDAISKQLLFYLQQVSK